MQKGSCSPTNGVSDPGWEGTRFGGVAFRLRPLYVWALVCGLLDVVSGPWLLSIGLVEAAFCLSPLWLRLHDSASWFYRFCFFALARWVLAFGSGHVLCLSATVWRPVRRRVPLLDVHVVVASGMPAAV